MTVFQGAGVYDAMDEATYFGDPVPGGSLSQSGAKTLLDCPARFKWERDHGRASKRHYDLGHAAHKYVLGTGPRLVVIDADNYQTKAAQKKRDEARADGAVPLLRAEHDTVLAMAAALREHPVARYFLDPDKGGTPEQSLFWQDGPTGVWRRARIDWLPGWTHNGRLVACDYKSAAHADDASVARACLTYRYHLQDHTYREGMQAVGLADNPGIVFVFQEKEPPFLVNVIDLDGAAKRAGRLLNRKAVDKYVECVTTGDWHGYERTRHGDIDVHYISLPPWATRDDQ